ncbi:alpha/beta hydrolase [Cryobacterium adonitolivorans]|uniref:Alpha/beta hydrolase n=1 Tax=Cryobacterium adonitolivorans TaxID=1259189 RepID=A0A4R8W9J6_9MICO|nr:alpha/beta hydrolase [Cryobacterium adonitolivorans]TFC02086.1 alpha/beta hydrolase [Cryobacterium adonitolivorans]
MRTGRRIIGLGSRRFLVLFVAYAGGMAVVASALLGGLHWNLRPVAPAQAGGTASEVDTTAIVGIRTYTAPGDAVIDEDVVYATQPDGTQLTLDVCSPPEDAGSTADADGSAGEAATGKAASPEESAAPDPGAIPVDAASADQAAGAAPDAETATETPSETTLRPAVLSIHGGSWARGDKGNSDWRNVCEWLASEGFVAYSVNYRLVPAVSFPAAIEDLGRAVEWMRANAEHYGIDPDRIGAFGGSAGGNLATLLGARGSGSLTDGSRVAAVAELSGPVDLSYDGIVVAGGSPGLEQIVLDYLDCESLLDCRAARDASAVRSLDRTDPPVFVGSSTEEFIPLSQSTGLAADLNDLGIVNQLVTVPGSLHSIGILDAVMRGHVSAFLHEHLGTD